MNRRRLVVWLLALPVMLAGSQLAHALAYRLVYPDADVRLQALVSSGHSYLSYLPLVLGISGAIELLALLVITMEAARGRAHRPLPTWAFGVTPMVGFALQELIERWLGGASFQWQLVLEPTFRVGLSLQIPVGLIAYAIVRLLQRAAETAGAVLARGWVAPRFISFASLRPSLPIVPQLWLRAAGWSPRGPPWPH